MQKLSQARQLYSEEFSGARQAGQVPFLPPGMAYKHIPYSAVDIELVKLLELSIEDVCRIYEVPARKIAHYRSGIRYPNDVEAANTEWEEKMYRRTHLVNAQVTSQLLTPIDRMNGLSVRFDTRWIAAGTISQRIASADQGVARSMVLTPNEGRHFIQHGTLPRLDPIEGGDELIAPKGGPGENASGMQSPGATPAGEETEPVEEGE